MSSLSKDAAQSRSVRAWLRCLLQQHLHKNPDGSDSRTGAPALGRSSETGRISEGTCVRVSPVFSRENSTQFQLFLSCSSSTANNWVVILSGEELRQVPPSTPHPRVYPFLLVLAGRVLQEQLCELTRLVLRLPEVDGLLQRAGLQAPATKPPQPASALEVFVKVTGVERGAELRGRRGGGGRAVVHGSRQDSPLTDFHTFLFFPSASTWGQALGGVYAGLQLPSERSSMESRALDYIEDIMKYIKPSLVSKNQEGHQLVYWAVGRWKALFREPLQPGRKGISSECVRLCFFGDRLQVAS